MRVPTLSGETAKVSLNALVMNNFNS